jgi:hypothetical protein
MLEHHSSKRLEMKTAIRCIALFILPMLFVAFALPMLPMAHAAGMVALAHPHSMIPFIGAGAAFGMLRIQAVGKSRADLDRQANPQNAGQPEAIPWVYYDTQNIATATAGPYAFFAQTQADKTLSNLEQAGTIPDPFYFELEAVNCDFLVDPTLTATVPGGVLGDITEILNIQRAVFVFTFAGKEYLRIPLTYLHASGGPNAVLSGTFAAPLIAEFAVNSYPDGGFYIGKRITIPPKQSFSAQIQVAGATTLAATVPTRISLAGVLHRRIL